MQLKPYQQQTLNVLGRYLAEARVSGAMEAFAAITGEPEQAMRLRGLATPYKPLNGLMETPYVCLRLPTGGGKTILAAYSIAVAKDNWLERDFPLVLWLVPTTTIRRQTVEALKNPQHAYRQVLDEAFGGRVRVFDIGDFQQITPHDLQANCCVIVGTIQTLRVDKTEGRKVYAHNEDLEPHFSKVPKQRPGLELIEPGKPGAGTIKFSLANLLHLYQPLMIVDEAHKAVTDLSQTMQQRVNPSAIVEFTATPQRQSNLLHSVSAQELKDAEMIKLPVMLAEHPTWQQAVDGAIAKREELADIASKDHNYIRPIVLFQAQDRGQVATVEVLKSYLLELGITERRIAIATGEQRELDNLNLFDPACDVDFIITVEALKEGWDCSFAYVFCSLANIHSSTDVEQLLGRVLRMPYASRRGDERLNRAYAHLASPRFSEAAMALKDRMVAMGFREDEAIENILPEQGQLDAGLFGPQFRPKPSVTVSVELDAETVAAVRDAVPEKVQIVQGAEGPAIKLTGFLTPEQKTRLTEALPPKQAERVRETLAAYEVENGERLSPADKGERMIVPALMASIQGELELAETDLLMEHCDWSLLDHSAQLDAGQFDLKQTANTFEIDLAGRGLRVISRDPATQLSLDVAVEGWSELGLVTILTKQLRQPDLDPRHLIAWLSKAVSHLTGPRNLPLSGLMQCKFVLARALGERISAIRKLERTKVYQSSLFGPEARPSVSYERGFVFWDGIFASARKYQGDYTFSKHFTGPDNVPAFDGKPGGDEEFCARQLDGLPPATLKHWVRNVPQHTDAFWLPLAGGRFYPDFIAELADGRLLVVEYKGDDRVTNDDTKEKVLVGDLWEKAMAGKGLFLLVEKLKNGKTPLQQLKAKIGVD